ncbi:MAG: hypothetical protein IPO21_07560 [Bacteroidales bacterium]|nr:hypothetical protein [Bacteroidales bacterium]
MKNLFYLLLCLALFSCKETENKQDSMFALEEILTSNRQFMEKIAVLKIQQDTTTDVDKLFEIDAAMYAINDSANITLKTVLNNKKHSLDFTQIENTDKIKIDSLTVVDVALNTLKIEAKVTALQNSSFDMVYTTLSALDSTGKKLDIAGGIGADSKLEAGKSYIFSGEIKNIDLLKKTKTIQFDEVINKW